ncbi:MAG: hypothetical protein ACPGUV_02485 [Polyangiales bacterium]
MSSTWTGCDRDGSDVLTSTTTSTTGQTATSLDRVSVTRPNPTSFIQRGHSNLDPAQVLADAGFTALLERLTLSDNIDTGRSAQGASGTVGDCMAVVAHDDGPELCLIAAKQIVVPDNTLVQATGQRALVLYAPMDIVIKGTLSVSHGGAGVGVGSDRDVLSILLGGDARLGAAGAGFGSPGGAGGAGGPPGGAVRGNARLVPLLSGAHGGLDASTRQQPTGGRGGGALQLSAARRIVVQADAAVLASGEGGMGHLPVPDVDYVGGSGGGSGGALLLEAPVVRLERGSVVAANGGGGGGGFHAPYASQAGQAGVAGLSPARGGVASLVSMAGDGGMGASAGQPAKRGQNSVLNTGGAGGGGGGVGRIRINSRAGAHLNLSGVKLSPLPSYGTLVL